MKRRDFLYRAGLTAAGITLGLDPDYISQRIRDFRAARS